MHTFLPNPPLVSSQEIDTALATIRDAKARLTKGLFERERDEILPFFKQNPFLCNGIKAAIGQERTGAFAFEFELLHGFHSDLVIIQQTHKSLNNKVLLVEFESGKANRLFRKATRRKHPKLGTNVIEAYSQILDWLYDFDQCRAIPHYQALFGENPVFSYLIVAGRSSDYGQMEQNRLSWLTKNLKINSSEQGVILSYDDLLEGMEEALTRHRI